MQVGPGVDPSSIDYALDRLRRLCEPHPVRALRVRISRADHPARRARVLVDVSAEVGGRTAHVSATGPGPHASVDKVADQLTTRLQALAR